MYLYRCQLVISGGSTPCSMWSLNLVVVVLFQFEIFVSHILCEFSVGTRVEDAKALMAASDLKVISCDSLDEAAAMVKYIIPHYPINWKHLRKSLPWADTSEEFVAYLAGLHWKTRKYTWVCVIRSIVYTFGVALSCHKEVDWLVNFFLRLLTLQSVWDIWTIFR